jgi:RNA recognition motif-containing protein
MLQDVFTEKFPSTLGAKVVMDPVSGMSKGFGFVRFGEEEEKDSALTTMTGVTCGSRTIRVAPATAKKAMGAYACTHTHIYIFIESVWVSIYV